MATPTEHGAFVLSAIVPNRRDLLDQATHLLVPSHFVEKVQQNLFSMLTRYSDVTGGNVMPSKFLDDQLKNREAGTAQLYAETYDLYSTTQVDDGEFLWSLQQLRDHAAEKATAEVITDSMEILRQGKTLSTGEIVKGHEDARGYLLEGFANIDRELTQQDAPEGDLKDEKNDILADYQERKASHLAGTSQGILFGVPPLDAKIGGMQNGELILIAGYSSDGKTTLSTQAAWSAAIEQGKNVVFLTTETLRHQVRRKIVARHSVLPMFGLPDGLNTRDIKGGTLTLALEAKMAEVVTDLTTNPEYGRLYIAQVPRSATISSIEQRLARIQRSFNIDFVVMDYLALMVSDRRRQTAREELAAILKEAKQVATTFDNGRGVPFLSPWQVSRAARENAEKLGMYTSGALSETAESTNSADVIVSLLAPTDNTERRAEVSLQVLKHRDGETANNLIVEVDYATSAFRYRGNMMFESATTSASAPVGLDELI